MKIGIVGTGFVGSTAAYTLVMKGLGTEIVLIDKNTARASAEAADIRHAVPFAHTVNVRQGDYHDLAGSSAVVVAVGRSRVAGQGRLDLAFENAAILREVIPAIIEHCPCSPLIITTNPVDVMTHVATRIAVNLDVPPELVIGTGTVLDTARFRTLLGAFFDIESSHVHAYVVGEHGDSEVMAWSLARIGGLTVDELCSYLGKECDAIAKQRIDDDVRHAGRDIILGKGATYYGIGSILAHIVDSVVHDHSVVAPV
jgi:L-lactate dehydrogenase